MSLDDLIGRFTNALNSLDTALTEEMQTVAEDGLAMVDRRIVREGKGTDGPLPDYTPAYLKKKEKAGRYRGHVDLTLSGDMWKNIGVVSVTPEGDGVRATVGGMDQKTRDKMMGNNRKRPGFLSLTNEEIEILAQESRERVTSKISDLIK